MTYPLQYFRLAIGDTDNNISANGSSLSPSPLTGKPTEKWYVNYISTNVFQIANASNNQLITASGNNVVLANNSNSESQKWKIEGVDKDYEGFYLYYKITSNSDSSKSLTYIANEGFSLTKYSGINYQKFKLNLDGLEGFAANCKTSSGEKAGTIGGLLGPVVVVSSKEELLKECNLAGPKTIVLNANVDLKMDKNSRIREYITIVGSFKYHTIFDCRFRNTDPLGKDAVSDNIVIRNLTFEARDDGDRILLTFNSVRQLWIDHITFNNTISYNRKGDGHDGVGKFIWINTPYPNDPDAKDLNRSPDYISISYCKFINKFWCFAYGTQNTEIARDRTTLLYNLWDKNVRRCPQLGNGAAHIYNNYYQAYGQNDNGPSTTGIIGGDGSEMLSQNNMFNGYTKQQALMMGGDTKNPARDDNSYISTNLNGNPEKFNFSSKKNSSWNPNKTNYGYELLDPYNTSNTDTKAFCTKYTGSFSSQNDIKYITDSDFSKWIKTKYASPFLKHVDFTDSSSSSAATFKNGTFYKIKNKNSGLYMQVIGGTAENGTKIQQWGSIDGTVHDIWKTVSIENGYYYLVSGLADGGTYFLDVTGKSTANGTSMEIYHFTGGTNQQFYISDNYDGTFIIKTRVSGNNSAVEVKDAGLQSGDIVQQWALNGHNCQNWIFEKVGNPGCQMDTTKIYEFENVNSKLVLDILDGKMENNTNVQQSASSHADTQRWSLKPSDSNKNFYSIHSVKDSNFALKVASSSNGGNICIAPFSSSDNSMLFKFSKNPDGSYMIMTLASKDEYFVEVINASTQNGANVQQWVVTNHVCQNWKLNEVNEVKLMQSFKEIRTRIYKDDGCVHTVVFVK